jgi:hypothetical protein
MFSDAMRRVQGNLIPGLEENSNLISNSVQRILGTTVSGGNVSNVRQGNVITVSPTININSPKVDSDQDITKLADKVADVMLPTIKQAIGGDDNSY